MKRRVGLFYAALAVGCLGVGVAYAASILSVADFNDGTTQGWNWSGQPTSIAFDEGPSGTGDHALEALANPFMFRIHVQTITNADFLGNYLAADAGQYRVTGIAFDAKLEADPNVADPNAVVDSLELYAVTFSRQQDPNDPNNTLVSQYSSRTGMGVVVTDDGQWHTDLTISLREADLVNFATLRSYVDHFSAITQAGFRHQTAEGPGGESLGNDRFRLLVDNIRLVGTCRADLDDDGDVDLSDLAQLLANYGTASGATYEDGDLDGDGDVDLSDLAALLAAYGTTCP